MRTLLTAILLMAAFVVHSADVKHQLTIDYKTVDYTGKPVQAMAINNTIPGPVLTFTQGDIAVINVTNNTDGDTSIHWHGLLLPQEQDGVPYLTMFPIAAGESFKYRFELKHAGTYWYHSHSKIDEQRGQYGAIVVHPKAGYQDQFDHDVVVQLSDWTDQDPVDVLKNLKMDGDWYAHKKKSVISLQGYLENSDLSAWLSNRWQRMEGMDVSDVGYDAFLANGAESLTLLPHAKVGDKVRVRLINSGASSIFDVVQNAGPFEIVAADGVDVTPIKIEKFRIAMAETYDFIVSIPPSGAFEFAANNIDGTGGVRVTLGSGQSTPSPTPIKPNLFKSMVHSNHQMMTSTKQPAASSHQQHAMTTPKQPEASAHQHHAMTTPKQPEASAHQHHTMTTPKQPEASDHQHHTMTTPKQPAASDHQHHTMTTPKQPEASAHQQHTMTTPKQMMMHGELQQTEKVLEYDMLKSRSPVKHNGELQEFTLELTGNMDSYNWSFNNIALSQADVIKIDRGKVVRFHFVNKTMMNHPMHLHGHFFKVLSGNGDYDVIKHTVNVPPMGSVTIEFEANEYKDWLFHCHNLYHAKTGMARVVRYSDYQGNPDFVKAKANSDEIMDFDWYNRSDISVFNHHTMANVRYSNSQHSWQFKLEHHFDEQQTEYQVHYNYKQSRWLDYYLGVERKEGENELQLGVKYELPFSIATTTWLNQDGEINLEADTEFQLTPTLGLALGASTESEWEVQLEYRTSPSWSIAINANDESGLGIGLTATF